MMTINVTKHEESIVEVGDYLQAADVRIVAGKGAKISIGSGCVLGNLLIHACDGASVSIGLNVGFNGAVRLLLHESRSIRIGDDCLIAGNTDITVSDMHSILEIESMKRVNPAADVNIGDRVWIGHGCLVLKGSNIGEDSVIGARSVVTGTIPPSSLAVGSPARVIKSGIKWDHRLL